jgi:outer membrane protein assembly factor BamB
LVVVGTDDPDSTIYAVNALTGVEVWRFAAVQPAGD